MPQGDAKFMITTSELEIKESRNNVTCITMILLLSCYFFMPAVLSGELKLFLLKNKAAGLTDSNYTSQMSSQLTAPADSPTGPTALCGRIWVRQAVSGSIINPISSSTHTAMHSSLSRSCLAPVCFFISFSLILTLSGFYLFGFS